MKKSLLCALFTLILAGASLSGGCSPKESKPVVDEHDRSQRVLAGDRDYQMQALPDPNPDVMGSDMQQPVVRGADPVPGMELPKVEPMPPVKIPEGTVPKDARGVKDELETKNKVYSITVGSAMGMSGIGIGGGGGITMGSRGAVGGRAYGMAASPSPSRMVGPGMAPPRSDFDAKRDNENFNTESYAGITENAFLRVGSSPLSTFSIDVDTASYANMRRMILGGSKPLADAIRIEELVNYFTYGYKGPDTAAQPFAVHTEVTSAPWAPDHLLARVGIQGRTLEIAERKASNLVFLLDVSGSMSSWNKLPMLSRALRMLVEKLDTTDRVAIVVYAGAEGVALPSTSCKNKTAILNVLDQLQSGGSTNAGAGIQLAYKIALENFIPVGVNRVILATDGDFNVGLTSEGELLKVVEGFARKNVFLTILGFGMGNYKDSMLETLSNKGNGNYAYIDSLLEAEKVLVKQMGGTLVTIAKDVKLQVEFNPKHVGAYRLIGYENRIMAAQDFNDDTKDAGEIGAGHTVTALYEIIPPGQAVPEKTVDPLKYQTPPAATVEAEASAELFTVKVRYKTPEGTKSSLLSYPVSNTVVAFDAASGNTRFAAAVAGFGMLLRGSKYKGDLTFEKVLTLASAAKGADVEGYRAEFITLVKKTIPLFSAKAAPAPAPDDADAE